MFWCQCPLGLIPHFYFYLSCYAISVYKWCQCPLGLIPHFYIVYNVKLLHMNQSCQCPLGLIPHFYISRVMGIIRYFMRVNALSGLYLISTDMFVLIMERFFIVSMPSRAYTSFLLDRFCNRRNEPIKVSMPSRAYTSFLRRGEMTYTLIFMMVSMPSRAYTSFLRYPFKNLGFMRFPEPVFAGIYQNILTTAVFRAC